MQDSKGCSSECSVTINEPAAILNCTITIDNDVLCFGDSNGEATVTAVGGNGGYLFLWDNGETTAMATMLNAGVHTVTVTDSKGCSTSCEITINEPSAVISCMVVQDSPVVCFGESNGVATVTPAGGNGGYTYLWDNGETTQTAIMLNAGIHNVLITDSKGCSTSCTINIGQPSAPLTCSANEDSPVNCLGESSGIATVTPDGGNGGYMYLWDNGETTATASMLDAGSHSVTITDLKDCTSTCTVLITEPAEALSCSAVENSPVVCFGESNGVATVTPIGGNGTYSFLWDNGETTATAVALNAGLHSVTVTDFKGCLTSCDILINQPTAVLSCSASEDFPVVCNGESNGVATAIASGGNGNYAYLWDNGETTATATALNAGLHTITITDDKGCTTTCDITINEPAAILSCNIIEESPVECFGEANGIATVTATGGNGNYTYLWDNGETSATASSLDSGLHTVTVTDDKDCTTTCDIFINEPSDAISCSIVEDSPVVCFNESNGVATVTPFGGNGGYSYFWDNGETTATATGLNTGLHIVTVTDSKGCSSTCDITINQPSEELNCSIVQDSPVVCFGESNGVATVTSTGGNGTNTFLWDNGETTATAIALNAGTHSVTVTDFKGCTTSCEVIIEEPSSSMSCTITEDSPVVCFGESNGQATVLPSGGNGNYTYLWDNGETLQNAIALDAGIHTVTVTDEKGCTTSCDVTINQPAEVLSCSIVEDSPVVCFGEANGVATVTPVGGNGGYIYTWDNGESSATANSLTVGDHSVTITDSKGCSTSCSITINEPAEGLACSASEDSPVVCKGEANGIATVVATGGNNSYTYAWDNGETTATAIALTAGTHFVTVTDDKDCITTCSVEITEPAAVLMCTINEDFPVECKGEFNGIATVTALGGNDGYTYLWDNGESNATAVALSAGTHTVTVTDARGCTTTCEIEVTEPTDDISCTAVENSPVVCFGESNGTAAAIANGGNGGYTYFWDNGETTADAISLNAGFHSVTITDAKGCTTSCGVVINQPSSTVTCSVVEDSPASCVGSDDGQATVSPSGGNGTFTFEWDNGETTQTATALTAGPHTVTVTDIKGCSSDCTVTIGEPAIALNCSATEITPVQCNGFDNGEASVTAAGGNGGYSYAWDNGETGDMAFALNAGTHTVTVTDSKGCTSICEVIITQPDSDLLCSVVEDAPVVCFGESNGQATVTATGGNGGYTYLWDNGETTASVTNLTAGTHSVTVTDDEGCDSQCSVLINEPSAPLTCSAVETKPVECNLEDNGQALVTPEGGNGGYTYLWDNGETTAAVTNLSLGIHSVTVTDSKGCTTFCTVEATEEEDCCRVIFTNRHIRYNAPNPH